jgi:protein-L-isoaspartate O-methyltransferase
LIVLSIEKKLEERKEQLIAHYVKNGYIKAEEVIRAFRKVPRELFIGSNPKKYAYLDRPLGILGNQTISAPHF